MKSWEALEILLAGYLHEDFAYLDGSAWGAVESFTRNQPEEAPQLHGEITDLLSLCQSESELERAVARLGLNYLPSADGWTSYRTWLLAVADRVDDLLRKSPAA